VGGARLLCPGSSDINLFRYGKGIINLDAAAPPAESRIKANSDAKWMNAAAGIQEAEAREDDADRVNRDGPYEILPDDPTGVSLYHDRVRKACKIVSKSDECRV
jgi:hypothetical protein